jgi:hypothetical protein
MSNNIIIGIIGLNGSGKNTIANILQNEFKEYNFVIDSFAKPVKDIASIIFNWNRDMLEGDTKESREWREEIDEKWSNKLNKEIIPRKMLQLIGTEFGRELLGRNIWIDSLKERSIGKNIVISDIRFQNEAEEIKKIGGILIRVNRGEKPTYLKDIESKNFNSINELREYMRINYPEIHEANYCLNLIKEDYIVENNDSIDILKYKLKEIIYNLI